MKAKQTKKNYADRMVWEQRMRGNWRGMSIYTLLWLVMSIVSIAIVVSLSIALYMSVSQTYKNEVVEELEEQKKFIQLHVTSETPASFNGNYSEYIRFLSTQYNASILILDQDGMVVYPHMPDFVAGEQTDADDYRRELAELKEQIERGGTDAAMYESSNAYVYGAQITLYGGIDSGNYLYVQKSLQFVQNVSEEITERTLWLAGVVTIVALVVSSALAAWVIRPISAMTEKAKMLAQGDFSVEFSGIAYGREIAELAQTLDFARDEISKSDALQKELIANISHDFKTPLTMVKAYAAMIMEISGDVKEKRDKHAQVIIDEADRLASLVGDVLDLSKLQSGVQELQMATVDMSSYTQEILERFAYLSETRGYAFKTDVQEDLFARVDELKIGQVLYNLIGNAVNYTGEDKIVYVSLKMNEDEKSFRFAVRDTGKGIKEEELGTIWDRYYRSSETHKRPVRGTGLGLSIVKAVLVRHGLNFGVETELGKGSAFFVDFPVAEDTAQL